MVKSWRYLGRRNKEQPLVNEGQAAALPVQYSLMANVDILEAIFAACDDVVFRRMRLGGITGRQAALVYVDGLVNNELVNDEIMKSILLQGPLTVPLAADEGFELYRLVRDSLLTVANVREITEFREACRCILSGFALLFLEGINRALAVDVCGWEHRGWKNPRRKPSSGDPGRVFPSACGSIRPSCAVACVIPN